MTIILAPFFSTAAFICSAMMGWFSVVFEPVTMKTSFMHDLRGRVAHGRGADRLLQRHHRPAWHRRVQWSTLLVRNSARYIFCIR